MFRDGQPALDEVYAVHWWRVRQRADGHRQTVSIKGIRNRCNGGVAFIYHMDTITKYTYSQNCVI